MSGSDLVLTLLLALMALLYASVGHAGSSGYQAAMAIMGVSAAMMKPTALCLNVVVSLIATWQFARQGYVDGRRLIWLGIVSVPAAYLGGFLQLPKGWYYLLVAVVLWLAALRLWFVGMTGNNNIDKKPMVELKPSILLLTGLVLGFLSGCHTTHPTSRSQPPAASTRVASPAAAQFLPFSTTNQSVLRGSSPG